MRMSLNGNSPVTVAKHAGQSASELERMTRKIGSVTSPKRDGESRIETVTSPKHDRLAEPVEASKYRDPIPPISGAHRAWLCSSGQYEQ